MRRDGRFLGGCWPGPRELSKHFRSSTPRVHDILERWNRRYGRPSARNQHATAHARPARRWLGQRPVVWVQWACRRVTGRNFIVNAAASEGIRAAIEPDTLVMSRVHTTELQRSGGSRVISLASDTGPFRPDAARSDQTFITIAVLSSPRKAKAAGQLLAEGAAAGSSRDANATSLSFIACGRLYTLPVESRPEFHMLQREAIHGCLCQRHSR